RISHIEYGQNANAGIDSFASVTFTYATPNTSCSTIPVGSQVSYRTGRRKVTGSAKLTTIFALAYAPGAPGTPVHTRQITLAYSAADESCTAQHAPLRLLTSIQESAWGTDAPRVDLPAVAFEYGDTTVSLNA